MKILLLALIASLYLAGCSSNRPSSGTSASPYDSSYPADWHIKDSAPDEHLDWSKIPDAVPKWEPRARYGNHSPYKVLGKTYRVLPSSAGYREKGIGSWYGKKFAGRATSSQEPYDPYAMTAAHKTLPLPTYVRVTNLDNGKKIVVRVNDRGPFHDGRIIDLSFAAAHKLGYANKGTANVIVEAIDPGEPGVEIPPTPASIRPAPPSDGGRIYLQVGAFSDLNAAIRLQQRLINDTRAPVGIHSQAENGRSDVHRVRVGPLATEQIAEQMAQQIREAGLGSPLLIRR
ncbi:MAG: septal ring lytic transglycosylase RlpA family protein [Gammaproteobacteria bacterium]